MYTSPGSTLFSEAQKAPAVAPTPAGCSSRDGRKRPRHSGGEREEVGRLQALRSFIGRFAYFKSRTDLTEVFELVRLIARLVQDMRDI